MKNLALPAVVLLLLAACQPAPPDPRLIGPPDQIDLTRCGGAPVLALIGQNVLDMPASGGWGTLRVIGPGMAVTEDYSDTRLNVEVDAEGRIIGVRCG
jgi:hypothetical protein